MPDEDVEAAERLNDADYDSGDDGNDDFGAYDDAGGADADAFYAGESGEHPHDGEGLLGRDQPDVTVKEEMSFEELCRAHVEAFVRKCKTPVHGKLLPWLEIVHLLECRSFSSQVFIFARRVL